MNKDSHSISTPLLLTWLFIIVIAFVVLYLGWLVANSNGKMKNSVITDDKCAPPLNELLPVGDLCCQIGGQLTNLRLTELQSGSESVVVSLIPTGYLAACSYFCSNFDNNGNCVAPTPEYNQCIDITEPKGCSGPANPVATDGINYWYLYSGNADFCGIPATCQGIP